VRAETDSDAVTEGAGRGSGRPLLSVGVEVVGEVVTVALSAILKPSFQELAAAPRQAR